VSKTLKFCVLGDLLGDAISTYLSTRKEVTYASLENYLISCDADLLASNNIERNPEESREHVLEGLRGEILILLCNGYMELDRTGDWGRDEMFRYIINDASVNGNNNPFCFLIEYFDEYDVKILLQNATFKVLPSLSGMIVAQLDQLDRTLH